MINMFKIFTTVAICALGLSGCGGSGSSGSTNTPPPPPIDNTSPSVSFSPTSLTVESGMTGSSTLTAADNVGVTTGPNVTCTNGGSFVVSSNIFTAAEVTAEITSVCTATARDAAGNEGSATLTVTMTPLPDNMAPVVTFSPMSLTINSGEEGLSTLSAIDDVDGTIVPIVRCENDASFDTALGRFVGPPVTSDTTIVCTATARDEAGNESSRTLTVTIIAPNIPPTASANANLTIVMEGQPFTLDASASSDADGDELTFNWAQVSGTSVTIDDPTLAVQDLTAPELTADETLTFEVTASDGEDTDQAIISVMVEALRPPALTISQSSPFNAEPLREIYDITANEDGGYKVHWTPFGAQTPERAVSSRDYTTDGVVLGTQTDGEYQTGSIFLAVKPLQVVQSGDTVYNILRHDNGDPFVVQNGFSSYRGSVSGPILEAGDVFAPEGRFQKTIPIGTNQAVSAIASDSSEIILKTELIQPDGTSIETIFFDFTVLDRVFFDFFDITAFPDDSYAVIWENRVRDGGDFITDLLMQRVSIDGNFLGPRVKINMSAVSFSSLEATTMQGGQAFVAWDRRDENTNDISIRGRVINADGSFATDEFLINTVTNEGNQSDPSVIPLNTNQVFVTWTDRSTGSSQIRGQVINNDGTAGGNEFLLAADPGLNFTGEIEFATLTDGRVILGWVIPSVPVESFTLGLYPVGKQ